MRLRTIVDDDIQRLRERIKAIEIEAEEAAQLRLAEVAGHAFTATPEQNLADAEANLDCYLRGADADAGTPRSFAASCGCCIKTATQAVKPAPPTHPSA